MNTDKQLNLHILQTHVCSKLRCLLIWKKDGVNWWNFAIWHSYIARDPLTFHMQIMVGHKKRWTLISNLTYISCKHTFAPSCVVFWFERKTALTDETLPYGTLTLLETHSHSTCKVWLGMKNMNKDKQLNLRILQSHHFFANTRLL